MGVEIFIHTYTDNGVIIHFYGLDVHRQWHGIILLFYVLAVYFIRSAVRAGCDCPYARKLTSGLLNTP